MTEEEYDKFEEIIMRLKEILDLVQNKKKGKKNHEKECPNTPSDRK